MTRFIREAPVQIILKMIGEFDLDTGLSGETTYATLPIMMGNIQAATGEMLSRKPEGISEIDYKTVFLHERVPKDSILVYDGDHYTLEKTSAWPDDGHSVLPHYMYLAERIQGPL